MKDGGSTVTEQTYSCCSAKDPDIVTRHSPLSLQIIAVPKKKPAYASIYVLNYFATTIIT